MPKLIESMSGTRGIIGETLTPQVALDTALSFGSYIKTQANTPDLNTIVVGGDTRQSHDMIKFAVISGLLSLGLDVVDIGMVPTPTVQQLVTHLGAGAGIVITASHNPIAYNGIKLMNHLGSFLNPDDYAAYLDHKKTNTPKLVDHSQVGTYTQRDDALAIHVDKILAHLDISAIQNSNLKVLIDANNGTGALANPVLFEKLGISYTMLGKNPDGQFIHDPEPLKHNLSGIISELKKGNYDIGFVQDADADRLVILDENGTFIGEDYGLALCLDYILGLSNEPNKKIVVNLSTSLIAQDIANKHNASLTYTRIGEPFVTHALREQNATVGGEGNGGVIYPPIGWGRDSLVGIVAALNLVANAKKPLSAYLQDYPTYTMIRDKFHVQSKDEVTQFLAKVEAHFPLNGKTSIDKQDGVKVLLEDAWLHARPSNTEPIVRIFVEAPTEAQATSLLNEVRHYVS